MMSTDVAGSRFPVGSSASRISGRLTNEARYRHALLFAARKFVRVVLQLVPQPDEAEDLRHPRLDDVPRFADHLQGKRHVVEHALVGEQLEVLEHRPDVPPEVRDLPRRELGDVLAGHVDVALGGLLLPQHQADERGLAGAGRPDDEDELALVDLDGDVLQRDVRILVDLGDVLGPDHGRCPRIKGGKDAPERPCGRQRRRCRVSPC